MKRVALGHRFVFSTIIFCAVGLSPHLRAAPAVSVQAGSISLPTYPWLPALPHPHFRGTDGKNIYPYPMLDNLSREKTNRTYRTVVLENQYLRATFLPELGGKIHEVIDKTTGQPMFYVNHVVKPGLIGMCGAWTSGGVEWIPGRKATRSVPCSPSTWLSCRRNRIAHARWRLEKQSVFTEPSGPSS